MTDLSDSTDHYPLQDCFEEEFSSLADGLLCLVYSCLCCFALPLRALKFSLMDGLIADELI